MKYNILKTEAFEKQFESLDNSIKLQMDKEIEQLKVNPYVGKPLGFKFFREKKVRNYRIYYIIYEEYVAVFVISLSDKKNQQYEINKIKPSLPYYKEEIKKILKL